MDETTEDCARKWDHGCNFRKKTGNYTEDALEWEEAHSSLISPR